MANDTEGTTSATGQEEIPKFLTAFKNADGSAALRFAKQGDTLIKMNDQFEISDATDEDVEVLAKLGDQLIGVSRTDGTYVDS